MAQLPMDHTVYLSRRFLMKTDLEIFKNKFITPLGQLFKQCFSEIENIIMRLKEKVATRGISSNMKLIHIQNLL
jgi:hypothetical protein